MDSTVLTTLYNVTKKGNMVVSAMYVIFCMEMQDKEGTVGYEYGISPI